MKDRLRRWLHQHRHHQLCRVVVRRVQVDTKYDMSPEYLVGMNPETGERTEIEVTVFGGRRIPIYGWKVFHG